MTDMMIKKSVIKFITPIKINSYYINMWNDLTIPFLYYKYQIFIYL